MPSLPSRIEQRTMRRVTWRITPFVMVLYFIAFIDRVNVGFAALTMNQAIGLSSAAFGVGSGVFFLGYFLFEVPSNLILERVGARLWIARVMITWGAVSAATALVRGPTGFYVLRFALGAAEAGFFPGIILYLSYWFPARHRASVTALFMAAAPVSTALGSPVSVALLKLDGALGLAGWQWLFVIEALPAIALGFVTLGVMIDRPAHARWLADDERTWLVEAMTADAAGRAGSTAHAPWRGLVDPRVLALSLVYFGTSAGLYTLSLWSPQILKQLALGDMTVGVLNTVPPAASVVAMVLWARHSDRTGERSWHVIAACLVAAAGLVMAGTSTGLAAVVTALSFVNIGISAAKPPLWSIPTLYLGGSAAAAGIATINSIGNLGGFVGPSMIGWIKDRTGSFAGGLYFVAALLLLSAAVTLMLARRARRPDAAQPMARPSQGSDHA